jgi:hypothetical protein
MPGPLRRQLGGATECRSPDAGRGDPTRVVVKVARLAAERPADAVRRAGIAAVDDLGEEVSEQVVHLLRRALCGQLRRVLLE